MDAAGVLADPGWSTNNSSATPHSSLPATPHSIVATPPPEGPPPPYPYPTWCPPPVTSAIPSTMPMPTTMPSSLGDYLSGSSIEYSPISSPGSVHSCNLSAVHEPQMPDDLMYSQSSMTVSSKSPLCHDIYYSEAVNMIPTTNGYQPVATTAYDPIMTTGYQPVTSYQTLPSSPATTISESSFGPKEVKMPQSK